MNEATELTEPSNRQEERENDRMTLYTQELDAAKDDKDGLVGYNQETGIWECRIEDCEAKMETAKRISHHRKPSPGTLFRTHQTGNGMPLLQKDNECNGQIIHPYGSDATRRKLER